MKRSTERVIEPNSFPIRSSYKSFERVNNLNSLIVDTQKALITNHIKRQNETEIICRFTSELMKSLKKYNGAKIDEYNFHP